MMGLFFFFLAQLGVSFSPRPLQRHHLRVCVTRVCRGRAQVNNNVLLLDHLNLNHERGRHDLVRAFYFDTLGLAVDPRKAENVEKGRKTLWANAGINQFHIPEADAAQVFDGVITLAYAELEPVRSALAAAPACLLESAFEWAEADGALRVTDPWGTEFLLVEDASAADARGSQPGAVSRALGMPDLCVHVSRDADLMGILRFYTQVFGCAAARIAADEIALATGPSQTLTFKRTEREGVSHDELGTNEDGLLVNDGVHVSIYLADLASAYLKADELGCVMVNHRFKRQAFSLDEALEQCMFRVLDVVDPLHPEKGPIVCLEHEVRSALTMDGTLYKSAPFNDIKYATPA